MSNILKKLSKKKKSAPYKSKRAVRNDVVNIPIDKLIVPNTYEILPLEVLWKMAEDTRKSDEMVKSLKFPEETFRIATTHRGSEIKCLFYDNQASILLKAGNNTRSVKLVVNREEILMVPIMSSTLSVNNGPPMETKLTTEEADQMASVWYMLLYGLAYLLRRDTTPVVSGTSTAIPSVTQPVPSEKIIQISHITTVSGTNNRPMGGTHIFDGRRGCWRYYRAERYRTPSGIPMIDEYGNPYWFKRWFDEIPSPKGTVKTYIDKGGTK